MLRFRLAALCLLLASLTPACGASHPVAEGVPQATLDGDYADCVSMSYVSTAGIRSQGAADAKRQELIDACMKNKGYTEK
jgi:hypothetical protein